MARLRLLKGRMDRLISTDVDDSNWSEVQLVNRYAVFNAFLIMGVRGLRFLVITWTTVVLLGGFVSNLSNKDFWSLTVITLAQTAGAFNPKLRDFVSSAMRMVVFAFVSSAMRMVVFAFVSSAAMRKVVFASFAARLKVQSSGVQELLFSIIFCPLALMSVLGLYISAGISLWRLIEHDYGEASRDSHLKPALNVLYSLVVAQGVLFGYKEVHAFRARIIGLAVAENCSVDKYIVSDYLDNIAEGCEKDPSFATGRNLVTYIVHLMLEPKSNDCFIVGVRALGTIIENDNDEWGRPVLAKHLLTRSASRSHMIQRLLETLGPRSPYSTEIREHAARIVWLVAGSMYLEQFPRGIQCISSLLDTIEPHQGHWPKRDSRLPKEYERDWLLDEDERLYELYGSGSLRRSRDTPDSESPESDSNLLQGYARLIIQGLRIIQKLIVDEDNRRVIINTEGLLHKITMAPPISDKLHRDHHEEWNSILDESWELMTRLMAARGETGTKPQFEISSNSEAIISTLKSILECSKCKLWSPRRMVVEIVLDQSLDTTSITAPGSSSRRMFIWILLHIFLLTSHHEWSIGSYAPRAENSNDDIRILAGGKLQAMQSSQGEGSATGMLQSVHAAFEDLAKAFMDAGNNPDKVQAARILKDLCWCYTREDEYLKELKKAMVDVMPKVLSEILGYESTREEIIPAATEASNVPFSAAGADVESGGASHGDAHGNTSSSHQQDGDQQLPSRQFLQQALIDLCGAIHYRWYREDSDVRTQLDEIATTICSEQGKPVKDFPDLVNEAEFARWT